MAELAIVVSARNQTASALRGVQGDIAAIGRQARSVQQELRNAGAALTSMGKRLTVGVTAPILGVAGAAVKAAADYEQLEVSFTTMLGSAERAKTMMEDLARFASATPFESPEIQNASKMLLAFGVEAKDIIPTMTQLGDISAGLNIPLGDMAYLFGTTRAQGRLFTADLNQFTSRGIPMIKALAETMGVAESEIKAMVEAGKVGFPEVQAALSYLTSDGGQFAGLMEAQSGTLSGLLSTLKDNIGLTLTTIGQQIIETFDLKDKLKDAIAFLEDLRKKIDDIAKNNPELFRMGIIFGLIALAVGPALIGLGAAATALAGLGPAVGAAAAAFGLLISPLGLVTVGLIALAFFNFDTVKKGFEDVTAALKDFIATGDTEKLKEIENNIREAISGIKLPDISEVWNAAKIKITTVINEVDWTIPQAAIDNLITAVGDKLAVINWSGLAEDAGKSFANFRTTIGDKLATINWSDLEADAKKAFDDLKSFVQGKLSAIDWTSIIDRAGGMFTGLKTFVQEKLAAIDWSSMIDRAGAIFAGLKLFVQGRLSSIDWTTMVDRAGAMFGGLKIYVQERLAAIDWATISGEALTALKTGGETLRNAIVGVIAGVDWAALGAEATTILQGGAETLKTEVEKHLPLLKAVFDPDTGILPMISHALNDAIESISAKIDAIDAQALSEKFKPILENIVFAASVWANLALTDTEVQVNAAIKLGTSVLTFLADFGKGLDTETITTAITGFATKFREKLGEVLSDENTMQLGTAVGKLANTIVTKIGEFFGQPGFGAEMGEAAGGAVGTLAKAALNIATGIATELANVNWDSLAANIVTFVQGFVSGASAAIAEADLKPVGQALWDVLSKQLTAPDIKFGMGNTADWLNRKAEEWFGGGKRNTSTADVLRPIEEPTWIQELIAWKPASPDWLESLLGWRPSIPDWVTNLLAWKPAVPAWVTNLLAWRPGTPGWVTSLLGWRPSMPDWVSSLLSWVPGAAPPATNASGTNYFRGGLSWVGEQGPELVWAPRGSRIFSNTESMQMAGAGGGVVVNNYFTVNSELDLEAAAYRIVDKIRRRR